MTGSDKCHEEKQIKQGQEEESDQGRGFTIQIGYRYPEETTGR